MNKSPYSKDFSPPAPIFSVKLALTGEAPIERTQIALIDTGADGTFAPTSFLEEIGTPVVYMTNVRSYLGDKLHRVPVHMVDIILFDTIWLPNVEVVADDSGSIVLVGRNMLNKLHIQLDGPKEITSVIE